MDRIVITSDAKVAKIPKTPGKVTLLVEFPNSSSELVELYLGCHKETQHPLSRITSVPYGPIATSADTLDHRLDDIHEMAFGRGKWLNVGRCRDLSRCEGTPRQPVEDEDRTGLIQHDDEMHAVLERTEAERLSQELQDLAGPVPNEKKRKPFGRVQKARKLRKTMNEASSSFNDGKAKESLQVATHRLLPQVYASALEDACKTGRDCLPGSQETETQPHQLFADLFVYRRTRGTDRGQRLVELFDNHLKIAELDTKKTQLAMGRRKFDCTTLAENIRIVLRARNDRYDPNYSSKRNENRSMAINRVLDALYDFRGADAWGFITSLRASGMLITDISRLSKDGVDAFVNTATAKLRESTFENLPDKTLVFHFPAWLAWLSGFAYREVCEVLGLTNLADEVPDVASKLETLSLTYSNLSPSDLHYDKKRGELERKAHEAVTVSLGDLKDIHKKFGKVNCLCAFHTSSSTRGPTATREICPGTVPLITSSPPTPHEDGARGPSTSWEQPSGTATPPRLTLAPPMCPDLPRPDAHPNAASRCQGESTEKTFDDIALPSFSAQRNHDYAANFDEAVETTCVPDVHRPLDTSESNPEDIAVLGLAVRDQGERGSTHMADSNMDNVSHVLSPSIPTPKDPAAPHGPAVPLSLDSSLMTLATVAGQHAGDSLLLNPDKDAPITFDAPASVMLTVRHAEVADREATRADDTELHSQTSGYPAMGELLVETQGPAGVQRTDLMSSFSDSRPSGATDTTRGYTNATTEEPLYKTLGIDYDEFTWLDEFQFDMEGDPPFQF